jgi:hypothetical protein
LLLQHQICCCNLQSYDSGDKGNCFKDISLTHIMSLVL